MRTDCLMSLKCLRRMKIRNNANANVSLEPSWILYLLIVSLQHKIAIPLEILQNKVAYFMIAQPENLKEERRFGSLPT